MMAGVVRVSLAVREDVGPLEDAVCLMAAFSSLYNLCVLTFRSLPRPSAVC